MGLEENVALRKKARELLELSDDHSPAFLRVLSSEALRQAGAADDQPRRTGPVETRGSGSIGQPAMTDAEARAFERGEVMPYGKHRGKRIGEVPLEYLCWVRDKCDERGAYGQFVIAVQRYLRSPAIAEELRRSAS